MSTIPKMAYMSRDSRFHITNPNTLNTVYANGGENTTQKKNGSNNKSGSNTENYSN